MKILGGLFRLARLQRLLGLVQGVVQRRAAAAGQFLDELAELALGQRAGEGVHRLAVAEGVDHGDRLDAELGRQFLVLVHVDLDQPDRAAVLGDQLFQEGAELLAGAAPRRPEIDDDRHLPGGLDDIGAETLRIAVQDGARAARSATRSTWAGPPPVNCPIRARRRSVGIDDRRHVSCSYPS